MSDGKSTKKIAKKRLDALLISRRLAETERHAQALIMAGEIRVNGKRAIKHGEMFAADAKIEIANERRKYTSRAGLKLEGALDDFGADVEGLTCLDIGASTGGFTDCLLQHGASRVYAADVNTAQLDWKLQRDTRVVAIRKNARYLKPTDIPEMVELVTVDVSFISVSKIISAVARLAKPGGIFLILIKPQFELPKRFVGKGGIVNNPELHERAITAVRDAAEQAGLEIIGVKPSRLAGAEGNREFFLHAQRIR